MTTLHDGQDSLLVQPFQDMRLMTTSPYSSDYSITVMIYQSPSHTTASSNVHVTHSNTKIHYEKDCQSIHKLSLQHGLCGNNLLMSNRHPQSSSLYPIILQEQTIKPKQQLHINT